MTDPLSEARIRAQRYWYLDGLEEITLGIICWLQAGWVLDMAPGNSRSHWFLPVMVFYLLLFVAFAIGVRRIKAAMRERITYPRSGYTRERLSGWKRGVIMVVVALLATAGSVLALRHALPSFGCDPARLVQWLPAVSGLLTCAMWVYVTVRHGLPRFLVVGVFALALGVAVSIEYPPRLATVSWLAGVGCALLCSGGVALWNYLRTPPPSADEP